MKHLNSTLLMALPGGVTRLFLFALCTEPAGFCTSVHAQSLPDYKLHPGDQVIIGVYDDPKFVPREITISPDGKIVYPLIGELVSAGKTAEQVRLEMEARLK
jgi:protein involved in polysaccharide export with SLBB domain